MANLGVFLISCLLPLPHTGGQAGCPDNIVAGHTYAELYELQEPKQPSMLAGIAGALQVSATAASTEVLSPAPRHAALTPPS